MSGQAIPPPGPVSEGQVCDSVNTSDADLRTAEAAQLVCQLSDEEGTYIIPARIANARKGDIVLSPGGEGLIADLLRNVDPPQKYSHDGILTRNFDELTHSTASEDRLGDHKQEGDANGFQETAIKYMWPGAVTQSVEAAINGELWRDPENEAKQYRISSFNSHYLGLSQGGSSSTFEIIPPMVVKPDPLEETAQVRSKLHALADEALRLAGKVGPDGHPAKPLGTHYRLYCYTNPSIALGTLGQPGGDAGWAVGTLPTVCSSFVWLCAKHLALQLESPKPLTPSSELEASDVAKGAIVYPDTIDGLYGYSKESRQRVAQWLFDTVSNKVGDLEAPWSFLLEAASDAKDDYANQVVNTFASDKAGSDGGDDWKNTGNASAVSPDNLMFWDSPSRGGLFGFVEPMFYEEPREEQYALTRWKKVVTFGTLTCAVRLDGKPVSGANVFLYSNQEVITDQDGRCSFDRVGLGKYTIRARKTISDMNYEAYANIELKSESLSVDLDLQPPSDRYRLLQIMTTFHGKDEEHKVIVFGDDDEFIDAGPYSYELELNPTVRVENGRSLGSFHWGGEVSCDFTADAALLADGSIKLGISGELWEGTGETHANEHFGGKQWVFMTIPKDQTQVTVCSVTDTADNTSDSGTLTVTASNVRNRA